MSPSIPQLTTIILTKNSVTALQELLPEIQEQSQEVIIWDDQSTDETPDFLTQYPQVRYARQTLAGDFAAHRNAAVQWATTDWILFLDSDERISPELWKEIANAVKEEAHDAYFLRRQDTFLRHRLRFGEAGNQPILRLAKRNQGEWRGNVHETWQVAGKSGELTSPLWHYPHANLDTMLDKLHRYAALEPLSRPRIPLWQLTTELLVFPPAKFLYNYLFRLGWLDGWPGLVHALIMSYYSWITRVMCYEAWYGHQQ